MKKFFLMAVMAVACMTANAQNSRHSEGSFTIQPMIGIAAGTLSGTYSDLDFSSKDPRAGLAIGAEGEYYTSTHWLSVSAGLMYCQQGWESKNGGVTATQKLDYINIPILANFYVAKGFALKIGLQPGFLVNADQDGVDFKNQCNTFNLAMPLGLSYTFKNGITLDLRGAASLTNMNKNDANGDIKWYGDAGMLTIGYKFSLK
jgi:opacity protein-like surface antigen